MTRFQLFAVENAGPRSLLVPDSAVQFPDLYRGLPLGVYSAFRTFEHNKFLHLSRHLARTERSMLLLGWHYGDYYWNAYAMNQYLANRGFVVLSINYRLGIGYVHDFQRPPRAGIAGASEYLDVKAAGERISRPHRGRNPRGSGLGTAVQ